MSIDAASKTNPPLCITNISAFFHLPNPRVFKVFIISSTATFSLGIAMILEWHLYSRQHPGYQWIVYYAASLISLPILLWIICITHAMLSGKKDHQQLHTETPYDPSESKPSGIEEKGQLQNVEASQDQPRNVVNDNSTLERTFSLPLLHTFTDHNNFKHRRMSF